MEKKGGERFEDFILCSVFLTINFDSLVESRKDVEGAKLGVEGGPEVNKLQMKMRLQAGPGFQAFVEFTIL